MKSHELIRLVIQKYGVKQLAAELKLSRPLLYKWMEPHGGTESGLPNPVDRIVQLYLITRDVRLVQWLCAQAGGFFVANPPVKPLRAAKDLLPVESIVMAEQATLLATLAKVLGHRVSSAEARSLRSQWEQCKSDMERLMASCERGAIRQKLTAWLLKFYPFWDALTPGGLI